MPGWTQYFATQTRDHARATRRLFNHGTHHRGQVKVALAAPGQPCPIPDRVHMLQQEQSAP